MGVIVVGLDGSKSSRAALDWAIAEARLRTASIRAVHAWTIPAIGSSEAPWTLVGTLDYAELDPTELKKAAGDALERELADAHGGAPGDLVIERELIDAPAADGILDSSRDAELIVIGTRGHGSIASLVLGSVSHAVIQRATCPVVVVHEPSE